MVRRLGSVLALIGSPCYLYISYLVARVSTVHPVLTIGLTCVCFLAAGVLIWLRYTRAGRAASTESQAVDWAGSAVVLVFLTAFSTAAFTSLSAGLYRLGVGTVKDGPLDHHEIVGAAFNSYLWHLADAIPLLKIPGTVNWELRHPFTDHVHGTLTLIYTLFVILPLVYAATQMVVARLTDSPNPMDIGGAENRPEDMK